MAPPEILSRFPDTPQSVQTVLQALDGGAPLTMKDLRERVGLARRTVYGAVRRLRELGLVRQQVSLRDSRQTYVWLAECPL